jgi:hypothetical protein
MTRERNWLENDGRLIGNAEKASTAPGHNEIRFDLCLAWIYPMVQDGDVDLLDLVQKIRSAIIATVNAETDWHAGHSFVRATGGNGNGLPSGDRNHPIHWEVITWDFS